MAKNKILVGKTSELEEAQPCIVVDGTTEIGIYRFHNKFYAYENLCPHQGGPACEGLLIPQIEEIINSDKTYRGMKFNYQNLHIVCPWHGWEYELESGEMVADRQFKLRKFEVIEEGEEIFVITE